MDYRNHVEGFQQYLLDQGRSKNTASAYASDARKFTEWLFLDGATNFGTAANRYINEQRDADVASASVVRSMSAIRSFRNYLCNNVEQVNEPFVGYKSPRRYRATAHPLPRLMLDVDDMVQAAWRPHHKLLVGLCGYAGLRVSEARSVTPRSLVRDPDDEWWLTIHGKGGSYREVPVNEKLIYLLAEYGHAEGPDDPFVPIQDRAARRAITEIGKRAGVARPVSSHDLRHTFASEVYSRTKDLRVTQELMGHSSSVTTEGYTGVRAAAKRAAVEDAEKVTRAQP